MNSLSANITQVKDELNMHRRRRTSMLQIDRFAEAMEVQESSILLICPFDTFELIRDIHKL